MATNTWAGDEKYAYIEFPKGQKREINGRTVYLPSFYVKHGQNTNQRHQASFLTPELAAQIAALYSDKNPEIHEETRHTNDSTAPMPKELFEVGEAVSASDLEFSLRLALRTISKADVQLVVDKVLAE